MISILIRPEVFGSLEYTQCPSWRNKEIASANRLFSFLFAFVVCKWLLASRTSHNQNESNRITRVSTTKRVIPNYNNNNNNQCFVAKYTPLCCIWRYDSRSNASEFRLLILYTHPNGRNKVEIAAWKSVSLVSEVRKKNEKDRETQRFNEKSKKLFVILRFDYIPHSTLILVSSFSAWCAPLTLWFVIGISVTITSYLIRIFSGRIVSISY